MIIYQIQKNGQATDFQFSKNCPDRWESIPGDRIPDDITPFHEQRYINAKALESQQSNCVRLLKESDEKVNGAYPNTDDDKVEWESYRAELRKILKSDTIQPVPEKPFSVSQV